MTGTFPGPVERTRSAEVDPSSHHFIVLSQLNAWMRDTAAPAARGVLLDFGCGGQPYREVFQPYVDRYIGADIAAAKGVELDLTLTAGQPIPLPSGSVDTVLSSQVIEHVFDVPGYLNECARVLRPGGRLILSAPMQYRHHEVPMDFWRFTRFGVERSLLAAGFSILDLRPCGGVFSLLGQIYLEHKVNAGRVSPRMVRWINRFALWLDRRWPDTEDTLLWMCIAERRPRP